MVVATGEVRLPRLLRRDAGAEVERLYRKHSAEVLRYALLVLRSRTDAEDVTQSVFIRALGALERGEKVRAPRNWLIKIAHNECRRLVSSRKLHVELPEHLAAEPEEAGRADELRRALRALPDAQRQALVLRELEGRSYNEIATTLNLSISAVETLIFRARRSLREQLEGSALSCAEFAGLLDDPAERSRVRAHARVCPECATLERQARGRKSALKRIASAFGLPWWGAKVAAVALTTATVAAVAVPALPHKSAPAPVRHTNPTLIKRGGTGVTSFGAPAPAPANRIGRPVVAAPKVPGTRGVPGTSRLSHPSAARPPAAVASVPVLPPEAAPAPASRPDPAPAAAQAPHAKPGSTAPPVALLPAPALPAPVPAPPAAVSVPTLPVVALPAVPAVPAPPVVPPPTVTVPAPPTPGPPTVAPPGPNVSNP
jgi:RNA polymerase sigma factor (sigma-70 family)